MNHMRLRLGLASKNAVKARDHEKWLYVVWFMGDLLLIESGCAEMGSMHKVYAPLAE